MPKAVLTFKLPKESSEYRDAIDGYKYRLVLWHLDQALRSKLKYTELPADVKEALQGIRDELYHALEDHNITLDD